MANKHDGEAIKEFIRKKPDISAKQFFKESKWKNIPNSVFRYYRDIVRKELNTPAISSGHHTRKNSRMYRRSLQRVYTTLWSGDAAQLGKEGISAIKQLVSDLNQDKVVKWEVIEMADPAVLEIRELTK